MSFTLQQKAEVMRRISTFKVMSFVQKYYYYSYYFCYVVVVQGLEIYEIQNQGLWVMPSSPCPLLLKGSFAVFVFVLLKERTVFTVSCRW